MRLTLRTLLSWKDGMLDAASARDFAARVGSSEPARRLVERIDEVAGRETLPAAAPDAAGFTGDANTTAEYLDNALDPGQLAEFERACFHSDVLLAETAATHELLASWWREPAAELSASSRRRLLAAACGRMQSDQLPVADAPEVATEFPRPRPTATPAMPASQPAKAPAAAWVLVAAALLLLIALVGVLGWSLTKGTRRAVERRDVAVRAADDAVAAAVPSGEAPPAAPTPSVAPTNEIDAPPSVPAPAAAVGRTDEAASAPADGAPEVQHPSPATPDAAADRVAMPDAPPPVAVDRRVPQGDALAIAAPAAPIQAPAPGPTAVPVAPPQAAAGAAGPATIAGQWVLLHRPSAEPQAAWLSGAAGSVLDLPVELVAPPFGRPTLDVGGARIALEPGTRAALGRDADGTPRLEIVFGAALVAGGGRIGVTAGELAGVVAMEPGAPVGVEVRLDRGPGVAADAARRVARVAPAAARIEWRSTGANGGVRDTPLAGSDGVVAVPAGQALAWRSDRPDGAALEAAGSLAAWLAGRRGDDPVDARAAQALASRLAAGTAAIPALRDLATDRRVECRLAAAATLAMLGEFAELARLLTAEGFGGLRENEWQRLDAVAVRPTLARGPKAADAFARAIADQGPPGAADTVVRLARGFTDDELAAGADAELVAALGSPHLVVRRYAIGNLVEITGAHGAERLHYRADWPDATLREKGEAWWRTRLEQGRIRRGAAAGR